MLPSEVARASRAWTSQPVLEVEADLTARLAARATTGKPDTDLTLSVDLAAGGPA